MPAFFQNVLKNILYHFGIILFVVNFIRRLFARTFFYVVVVGGLFLALSLATLKYGVMPRVANYQADILSRVSVATGMVVTAEKIEGGWSGFSPFLEITALQFRLSCFGSG